MVKKTETKVLAKLANAPLTPADRDKLVAKIGKVQTKIRARSITNLVEQQYANQYGAMSVMEKAVVLKAVRDFLPYVIAPKSRRPRPAIS
jgi:hypothetical protein